MQKNSLTLILFVMLLSGCTVTAKVWAPYDNITIEAAEKVNPDSNNLSSPTQIKIYELSSRSTFDNLDFDRSFYNAKTFLSDQLLSEAEYVIQPGESIKHTVKLNKNAKFIVIIASFIDIDSAKWKHVYSLSPYGHYDHSIVIVDKEIKEGKMEEMSLTMGDIKKGQENIEQANETKETVETFVK